MPSFPPFITFVSSFTVSFFFIRRIGYVATSLMRLSFNYRNGVSVFRFDCHTYYSRCAHPSSPSSSPSSTVFFSSLFSRDHGAVSQISFSRLSKFRGFTGYNHDHPGLFFVTFSSFHATNRSPIYYNKVYCYLCVTTE